LVIDERSVEEVAGASLGFVDVGDLRQVAECDGPWPECRGCSCWPPAVPLRD
jgi:hypothetical protein